MGAITLLDNFNRADGNPGSKWTQTGTATALTIVSQQIKGSSAGAGRDTEVWNASPQPPANHGVIVTLGATPDGNMNAGIVLRSTLDNTINLNAILDSITTPGHITFNASQDGSGLGGPVEVAGFAAGDKILVIVDGSRLRAYYSQANSAWQFAVSWAVTETAQGYAGLTYGFTPNLALDDFSLVDISNLFYTSSLLPKVVRAQRPNLITA